MRRSGQITVFLCLILTVILSFLCVCLESARSAGLRYRLQLAADSSLQSVFAGYDRILWEKYQLLFCSGGDREGSRIREEMLACASQLGEDPSPLSGLDWTAPDVSEVQVSQLVFATDQEGAVFEKAVLDYMKTGSVAILWQELQERLGDGSKTVAQVVGESAEKGEFSFAEVEKQYEDWKKEAEDAVKTGQENAAESGGEQTGMEGAAESGGEPDRTEEAPVIPQGNVIDAVKQLISSGVLALVVENPEKLSGEPYTWAFCPSEMQADERGRAAENSPVQASDGVSNILDTLLFDEYLLRFLDCYTSDPPQEGTVCQLEYVISGGESDRENLSEVVHRILWVREAFNLVYLLSDSSSRTVAQTAATALVGWTGIPFLVTGLSGLILAAWAYGESLADVRLLLDGGGVPLRKGKDSWQTSLEGLIHWEKNHQAAKEKDAEGLSYEDYLRLLLLSAGRGEKCYRAMDMIQQSMERLSPGFRFDCLVYSCEASLRAENRFRFLALPAFQPAEAWGKRQEWEAETGYHY